MLGLEPFRHMFGRPFTTVGPGDAGSILDQVAGLEPRQLVLLDPRHYTAGADLGQGGKTVALVGNGRVTGRGREIDAHEIVVRVNALYNWRAYPTEDGGRFDWWMGWAGMEMLVGPHDHPAPMHPLGPQLRALDKIIAISHASVEAGFLAETIGQGCFGKLAVLLSSPYVFDLFDREITLLRDRRFADLVERKLYHRENTHWGGFWGWDLLLTGIRACVMLALGRPRQLTLYGFDFYRGGEYTPWDMQCVASAEAVLECCRGFCRENGVDFAVVDSV